MATRAEKKITKIVVDCSTGVSTEVELTVEELEQRELDNQIVQAEMEAQAVAEAEKITQAESGKAKLKALGLTDDEIAALIK